MKQYRAGRGDDSVGYGARGGICRRGSGRQPRPTSLVGTWGKEISAAAWTRNHVGGEVAGHWAIGSRRAAPHEFVRRHGPDPGHDVPADDDADRRLRAHGELRTDGRPRLSQQGDLPLGRFGADSRLHSHQGRLRQPDGSDDRGKVHAGALRAIGTGSRRALAHGTGGRETCVRLSAGI